MTAAGLFPFEHTLTESDERVGSLVHQLVACSRIRELEETSGPSSKTEIRDLALQAGISTLYSSVFAKSGGIALVSVRPPALKTSQPVTSPLITVDGASNSPSSGRKVYDSKFLLVQGTLYGHARGPPTHRNHPWQRGCINSHPQTQEPRPKAKATTTIYPC